MRTRYSKIPTIHTTIKQNEEKKQNWWKSTCQLPADRSYFIFPTIVVGGKNKTNHNIQELTGWGRQRSGSDHEYNSPASYLRGHWEHSLSSCLHGWQWIWTTKKSLSNQAFFFFPPRVDLFLPSIRKMLCPDRQELIPRPASSPGTLQVGTLSLFLRAGLMWDKLSKDIPYWQ